MDNTLDNFNFAKILNPFHDILKELEPIFIFEHDAIMDSAYFDEKSVCYNQKNAFSFLNVHAETECDSRKKKIVRNRIEAW